MRFVGNVADCPSALWAGLCPDHIPGPLRIRLGCALMASQVGIPGVCRCLFSHKADATQHQQAGCCVAHGVHQSQEHGAAMCGLLSPTVKRHTYMYLAAAGD